MPANVARLVQRTTKYFVLYFIRGVRGVLPPTFDNGKARPIAGLACLACVC